LEWRVEVAAIVNDARVMKALEAVLWETESAAGTSNALLPPRERGVMAACALVKSKDQRAVEILVRASADPSPWVRYRVYEGIVTNLDSEKQKDPRLRVCVEQALNDPDQRVRKYAAWSAQAFHLSQQAELRLLEISRESPPDLRWAAIRGMATPHASELALKRMAEALADPDPEVRRTTTFALQRVKNTRVLSPLFAEFAKIGSEERASIIRLFSGDPYRNDPRVVLFLLPLVEDADEKVRSAAEQVLSSLSLSQEQREEKLLREERFQARRPGPASGVPTSP
jgi:HEAT repeat protein